MKKIEYVVDEAFSLSLLERRLQRRKTGSPVFIFDDNLAVVWARYRFLVDGKSSHCGVDSYQLVRSDAGWKLLHIVDTQRACGK